jgi:hypothetical protein
VGEPGHSDRDHGRRTGPWAGFLGNLPVQHHYRLQYTRRAYALAREEVSAVYPAGPDEDLAPLTGTECGPALDTFTQQRLHATLVQPVRHLLDVPGRAWRPYAGVAVMCLFGVAPEPYRPLAAAPELLHTASMIIDDIQDNSPLRRGRTAVHELIGTPAAITAGTTAYFAFDPILDRIPQHDPATMLRCHRIYLRGLRAGHAGQALDLAGHREVFEQASDGQTINPLIRYGDQVLRSRASIDHGDASDRRDSTAG